MIKPSVNYLGHKVKTQYKYYIIKQIKLWPLST